jgi:hypothetical protein
MTQGIPCADQRSARFRTGPAVACLCEHCMLFFDPLPDHRRVLYQFVCDDSSR